MDWGAVLVVLGLTVLVAVFLARPLVRQEGTQISEDERRLSALRAEQDRLLALIQELDQDRAMGKLLPEDYSAERYPLLVRGADVLRQIDALQPGRVGGQPEGALEEEIEAAVRRMRGSSSQAAGFCPSCGQALFAGDRFCSHCGAAVPPQAARA